MDQKRLLLAFVLSAVILFGWSYLFPPPANDQQNANTGQPAVNATPTPALAAIPEQAGTQIQPANVPAPDTVPQRSLIVSTPLYKVEFDSRGAIPRSWVIKQIKEKSGEIKPLRSASSTKDNPQELQLISPEGLSRGLAPLQISTGRQDLDATIASRNFAVGGVESETGNAELNLRPGEQKSVEFRLNEPASGVEVLKKLTFDAEHYVIKLETKVLQGGQPIPGAKIAVGPNIADQGVKYYDFYSIAPEGIAAVGDDVHHLTASSIDGDKNSPKLQKFDGPARWAAVGDTYFAMTMVLPSPAPGLEYRTEKYEHQSDGQKEERYLIAGNVPVPADGAPIHIFTGPKDLDQLQEMSEFINKNLPGQQVDLGQLINYGWTQRITKPLATPILWAIKHLSRLTGNYGLAIILFLGAAGAGVVLLINILFHDEPEKKD